MNQKATKIKIRIRTGRWFVLFLPALSFKFLRRISRLGLKFPSQSKRHLNNDEHPSNHISSIEQMDIRKLLQDLDSAFDELAKLEPFVLVEVSEETENVYVKIETV